MNCGDVFKLDNLTYYGFGPEVMKRLKVCPRCGVGASAAQHFCKECSAELPTDTLYDAYRLSHRICPACDAVAAQGSEYCPCCGMRLEQAR